MKLHSAVAKALISSGMDTMFGVIGDGNLFIVQSFVQDFNGKYVAAAHESGAVLMALGYAAVSGGVGIATTTYGPGLTNTFTALIEGVKAQRSILLICGDTSEERGNLQDVAQREIVIATGAGFEQVRSPHTVIQDIEVALRRALIERRPIVVNIPVTFQWEEVDYRPVVNRIPDRRAWMTESCDFDDAVGIIATAKRPIVLAGRGAIHSEARDALIRLAKRTEAFLATTLMAKDLFRDEKFNLGVFGTLSNPIAVEAIMESDCIIAFGASLTKYTTSHGTFIRGKRVVQCNLEANEIGKHAVPNVGLVGDPARVAQVIVDYLDLAEIAPSGFRTEEHDQKLQSHSIANEVADRSTATTIDVRKGLVAIEAALPPDRLVVVDGGRFMNEGFHVMNVRGPHSFVFTSSSGSIGLGLSYAIGASFGAPGRSVALVAGDGGFMLGGLIEFNTAVRYKVDLIVILCNDSGYGAEYVQFRERQMDPAIATFAWPDFEPVAVALGGHGVTVRSEVDLDRAVKLINSANRPLLIDLKLDPDRMPDRPR
jgi:acetolactate synthase I/II/III large subunit